MRESVIALKWSQTPWCHVFLEHWVDFESIPVRSIQLTCHSLERSHKITKNYFLFSLKSTKRRNGRSGVCELIHRDNITNGLITRRIFRAIACILILVVNYHL